MIGRSAAARAASFLGPRGSALRAWRVALLAALLLLVTWLAGPYTPWRLPGEQRLLPPPGQKLIYTVFAGLTAAAALNAGLCALLLATARGWARELPPEAGAPPARVRTGRGWWVLLLAAAALAGALRWPLAQQSLWWDEAWSVRKAIVGEWDLVPGDERAGGEPRFEFDPVGWLETLWYYRTPTNHALYSAAARTSLAAWRAATGAPPDAFDEFALRLPAWGAAIASVVLVGVLIRDLGFPRAALVAAFLLAIHPWHVRYGADGRGYAFVVLATLAGAWFLLRALGRGRWRDALGFAASQAALLWTFPLAVYVPLALGLGAVVACALGGEPASVRRARFVRLAVACLVAAMGTLQVMAPNLAQVALRGDLMEEAGLPRGFVRHEWVYLTTGLHARASLLPDVEFPTLMALADSRPWLPAVVYGLFPGLALWGLARAWLRGAAAERAALAGLVLPVPLFLLHRELQGFAVMPRFAVYGLACTVPLLALGLDGAAGLVRRPRVARAAFLALGVIGYATLVAPQLQLLLTRPIEPTREVIEFLAREEAKASGGAIRAGAGLGGDVPRVYDPSIREVTKPAELAVLTREATATGRTLFVFFGYGPLNHRRLPKLFALLDDRRLFEPIGRLDGIESETVFRVLRYTGEPLP